MSKADVRAKTPRRRRWCQFSLRTLLILTALFAGWLGYVTHRARQQRRAVEAIGLLRGSVIYDYEFVGDDKLYGLSLGQLYYLATGRPSQRRAVDAPGPDWLRRWIGDEYFQKVVVVDLTSCETEVTNQDLHRLGKLHTLKILVLDDAGGVTDQSLTELKGLTRLERLYLARTPITDQGLRQLQGMTNLTHLSLAETRITDDGLVHLKGLTKLDMLELCDTQISDAGLEHLAGLKNLKTVYVSGTRVTDKGVKKLETLLPGCLVSRFPPGIVG